MSRESTASPQPTPPLATKVSPFHPPIIPTATASGQQWHGLGDDERSLSPASVQEQLPSATQNYSYTPFSDSITTSGGDGVDGVARKEPAKEADLSDEGEPTSPSASIPEEHDTSRSTLVEEEEEEEKEEVGGGEDQQQQVVVAASVERGEKEETFAHEDKPLEDLSARSDTNSEHSSEASAKEKDDELVDIEQLTEPSEEEPPVGQGIPPGEQYSESFEEPSSVPLSKTPPLRSSTPPPELEDEATIATTAKERPLSEERSDIPEQNEDEQEVPVLGSHDGKTGEETDYQIGQRVLVGNVMAGTIRYVGCTHFADGLWVGVEIDLPRGRNDGSIDGQKYFTCEPKHGLFAPPWKISIDKEEENPEYEEDRQPPFEDEASSVAEELEIEEQLSSEPEQEDYDKDDQVRMDEEASPLPQRGSPPPEEGAYSPDFEPSPDEEEPEEEEEEEGEFVGQPPTSDEYQWPPSGETEREPSPVTSRHLEKEGGTPPTAYQHLEDQEEEVKSQVSETDKEMEKITKEIGDGTAGKGTLNVTEHPPPASETHETLGVKSESFPQAPEVANQRSQSATPTPAPPPEFAEGASKEISIEPPPPPPPLQVTGEVVSTLKQASDVISEELAQELTNEAYETMHNIWKAKRESQLASTTGQTKEAVEVETAALVEIPQDKLTLEDKADRVTDQLLMLLLQSETNLACSIHNFKKSQEEETHVQGILSPTTKVRSHQLPSPTATEPERPVLSPVPEEDDQNEDDEEKQEEVVVTPTVSPTRKSAPAKLTLTSGSIIESSPPPLSPPSPYRTSHFIPSFTPAADEFSPPGSPPKHLSQASAARVAAGEKTPFFSSQDRDRKGIVGIEPSTSTESITSLLDSLKLKTAQCMVPSERANINKVVESSWQVCKEIGFDRLHSCSPSCPSNILGMFSDLHELSPEENHCRKAYLELVFNLTVETLRSLHHSSEATPIWTQESAVRALLAPKHKNGGKVTLERVQKKVYRALMRGQLPSQLPTVKFLRGMKRPGGREIDFVDAILIKELREEEPGWIDYCGDEASVKTKTADAILDTLISETVQIMSEIGRKRCLRQRTYS